ncbi:MAG: hypothetical protein R3244_07735 [Thermoanaerobaculia bacterium]|nr:hypothetical protein [Thermoanaerobaculia bacterium]
MFKATTLFATVLLVLALPLTTSPADAAEVVPHQEGEPATLEGCLTQAADEGGEILEGLWVLTTSDEGIRILVRGEDALEQHDDNHKVVLTGTWEVDIDPEIMEQYDDYFVATEFEHVSTECEAPTNPGEGTVD